MNQTTYYLGAGASANAIPCVANLGKKIREFLTFLNKYGDQSSNVVLKSTLNTNSPAISLWPDKEKLNAILDKFLPSLDSELSIDTMAKIYYLQGKVDTDYFQLKAILYSSFLFWKKKNGIDNRYNNFWATLMLVNGKNTTYANGEASLFVRNVNIISWNYDCQLEDSLNKILRGCNPGIIDYPKHDSVNFVETVSKIPFLKLNGLAIEAPGMLFSHRYMESELPFEKISDSILANYLTKVICDPVLFKGEIDEIRFCWEENYQQNEFEDMKTKLKKTTVLVVIGYSFPSINHVRDSDLIASMTNLQKVYFQGADKSDSERIKDYFKAVLKSHRQIELLPIQANGFFIPPEATLEEQVNRDSFTATFL